jgi:hypothetical protein
MSLGSSAISECGSPAAAFLFWAVVAHPLLLALNFEVAALLQFLCKVMQRAQRSKGSARRSPAVFPPRAREP